MNGWLLPSHQLAVCVIYYVCICLSLFLFTNLYIQACPYRFVFVCLYINCEHMCLCCTIVQLKRDMFQHKVRLLPVQTPDQTRLRWKAWTGGVLSRHRHNLPSVYNCFQVNLFSYMWFIYSTVVQLHQESCTAQWVKHGNNISGQIRTPVLCSYILQNIRNVENIRDVRVTNYRKNHHMAITHLRNILWQGFPKFLELYWRDGQHFSKRL